MPDNHKRVPASVFATMHAVKYNVRFGATLIVDTLVGGIPSDPKVTSAWIRKNLGVENDQLLAEMVVQTMDERGMDVSQATDEVIAKTKLNGFKRDEHGLYIEGRQIKAAIKEASNICWPKGTWGPTKKGTRGFWAEHVFVPEERIHLGMEEPTDIQQRFVHTWRGDGIQYEEYVTSAEVSFTVISDAGPDVISDKHWAELWVTSEQQGIGASRGVGYGRHVVTRWERLDTTPKKRRP